MIEKLDFLVNGRWVPPITARGHEVIDPATEEPIAIVSLGNHVDIDRAVDAAVAAFPAWKERHATARIATVVKLLELYSNRVDELAQIVSREMGAPITLARTDQIGSGIDNIRGLLEAAKDYPFEERLRSAPSGHHIIREPVGVCALITPWNWPLNQITLKVAAAAIAGCTMILKPSEESPLSALFFAELTREAGFPPGVFNLVNGTGPGAGAVLAGHPLIDMVSFTGSTRAGQDILRNAADTVKRVALELGGKGANIIFADAKDDAVEQCVRAVIVNSGQSCDAPTRMLVQKNVYDHAVQTAASFMESVEVGYPSAEGSHVGPLVNRAQFDRVQSMIRRGVDEGARLVVGGVGRPPGFVSGYFVRPTLFVDVSQEMSLFREEIFGPVLTMTPFDDEEEAVALANDTIYGLGNYVQTGDRELANRVARRLRSGMVSINGAQRAITAPFGGFRQSGFGREGGSFGIDEFTEIKSIAGWHDEH